jgi:hypothetical protein
VIDSSSPRFAFNPSWVHGDGVASFLSRDLCGRTAVCLEPATAPRCPVRSPASVLSWRSEDSAVFLTDQGEEEHLGCIIW